MRLSEIATGRKYTIARFDESKPEMHLKFLSVGIKPGSEVEVERKTTFSKTLFIKVNQSSFFAIRSKEAKMVILDQNK